jgi:hypothetical protein
MNELKHILDNIDDNITDIKNKLFFTQRYINRKNIQTNLDITYALDKDHYYWLLLNLISNLRALRDKLQNG